jgi:hypothetical protein
LRFTKDLRLSLIEVHQGLKKERLSLRFTKNYWGEAELEVHQG